MGGDEISGYVWNDASLNCSHDYLLPELKRILSDERVHRNDKRLFELGCGNGAIAGELVRLGWQVTGVDPSEQGISQANRRYPEIPLAI